MKRVTRDEILDIAQYEKARDQFRRRIIELKKRRRLAVGPMVTFVFESHATVLFQIQEMMRAERIVHEDAIRHEIETYNQLLPGENELAATMFIEITTPHRLREEMARFQGVNAGEATFLLVGEEKAPGIFDAGQSDGRRISAVQYVRFRLSDRQRHDFLSGDQEALLVIDHPSYRHRAPIAGALHEELSTDLLGIGE